MADPVPTAVWWLALLLAGLVVAAVFWGVAHYEDDVEAAVEQALAGDGFSGLSVSVEGRDVVIVGVATTEEVAEIRRVVLTVPGVRRVDTAALVEMQSGDAAITPGGSLS